MLAIQLTLLAAGLVWGTVVLLRGSLMTACLAWLLTVVCFGRSFFAFHAGPVMMSIDRLVLVLLVAAYFVHRSLGQADPKPLCFADYLLFALLAWLTISTFTHDCQRRFFNTTSSPFWNLLAGYWMPMTVYWVARQSQLNERTLSRFYGFLVLLGLYLALTGLFEISGQWWLVFPRYIADPEIGIHFGRARGPFGSSVRYGVYVAVCFFAASILWRKLPRSWQILSFPLSLLFLAAIFFSYTRSVWLGMAAGVLVAAALILEGRMRTALLVSMCAAGLFLAGTNWEKFVFLEREESGRHAAVSVSNRAAHAYVSWKMFQDRPLIGCGYGQYPNEKLPYLYDRHTLLNLERLRTRLSHNTILTLLVEVGVVGLGLFLAMLAAWIFNAVKIWQDPDAPLWARRHAILFLAVLCVYLSQLLFHEVTFRPDINALVFMLAATLIGLRTHQQPQMAECAWLENQPAAEQMQPVYT